jgi:hypothetical protein
MNMVSGNENFGPRSPPVGAATQITSYCASGASVASHDD